MLVVCTVSDIYAIYGNGSAAAALSGTGTTPYFAAPLLDASDDGRLGVIVPGIRMAGGAAHGTGLARHQDAAQFGGGRPLHGVGEEHHCVITEGGDGIGNLAIVTGAKFPDEGLHFRSG